MAKTFITINKKDKVSLSFGSIITDTTVVVNEMNKEHNKDAKRILGISGANFRSNHFKRKNNDRMPWVAMIEKTTRLSKLIIKLASISLGLSAYVAKNIKAV